MASSANTMLESFRDEFTIESHGSPGEYRVIAYRGESLADQPLLRLDETLAEEYFAAALATWELPPGSGDRALEVLSLMAVHFDESFASSDEHDRVTELGLRRNGRGDVEWYRHRESQPRPVAQTSGPLVWSGYRPDDTPDDPKNDSSS